MSPQAALWTWTPSELPTDLWKFLLLSQPSLPFAKGDPAVAGTGSPLLHFPTARYCPPPTPIQSATVRQEGWQELPLHGTENCKHWHNFGQPKTKKGTDLAAANHKALGVLLLHCFSSPVSSTEVVPRYPHPKTFRFLLLENVFVLLEKRKLTLMKARFQPCMSNFINSH